MICFWGIAIMKSRTHDAYRDVVMYAWILQQAVWYGGEGHDYSDLQKPTMDLAGALSYAPVEDAPK